MDDREWLADRFEEQRPRLRSVAYRMLGSLTEADDALQDAWLRVNRAGADEAACPSCRHAPGLAIRSRPATVVAHRICSLRSGS